MYMTIIFIVMEAKITDYIEKCPETLIILLKTVIFSVSP